MWKNNDDFIELFECSAKKETEMSYRCPACGEKTAHIFFHRFEVDDIAGPAWSWCSSCKNYAHVRYMIPQWWTNLQEIDEESLCSTPEYLETIKDNIDNHMDKVIKNITE